MDKNLLRYMSVKVKKFDLKTNYFLNSETTKKESSKKQQCLEKKKLTIKKINKVTLQS